jgi:hypothetical protein
MTNGQSTDNGTNHTWSKIIVSTIIGAIIGIIIVLLMMVGMSVYERFISPEAPPKIKVTTPQAPPPAIKPPPEKIVESHVKKNIPRFELKMIAANIPQNDFYKSQMLLTIKSKTRLKNVYVRVSAKSIISFHASSKRDALVILGLTSKGGGYAFTNILNARGQYLLEIISEKPCSMKVTYSYK